jgi:streptogramin lyase
LGFTSLPQVKAHTALETASTAQVSYLYRFDTTSQSFFTIPLSTGAVPIGVAVTGTNPTHIWIAEQGLNRITQVVFTGTTDYTQTTYPITSTANSGPFLIAVDGSSVWFTEREANRMGRLNAATGHVDEFYGHGLPANAGLADLNVAPDGSVWVAGQSAKRLYRLVITSTTDYAFREYLTGVYITTTVGPFGIDVVPVNPPASYQIAFASPEGNRIGLLTPATDSVLIAGTIFPGYAPTDIIYDAGRDFLWFSEPGCNCIGLSFKSTLGNAPTQIWPIARPTFLTKVEGNALWLSQQDPIGQLARFVYTATDNYTFTSYALPSAGLQPNGVALSDGDQVWVAAYRPERLYLPLLLRNSGP